MLYLFVVGHRADRGERNVEWSFVIVIVALSLTIKTVLAYIHPGLLPYSSRKTNDNPKKVQMKYAGRVLNTESTT